MRVICGIGMWAVVIMGLACWCGAEPAAGFVRVSPRDPRYFELSDGTPYIPIGLNLIHPSGGGMEGMERWMKLLAENHGNFARVWLSNPFYDVESVRSGQYEEEKAKRIDWLVGAGRRHGIRLKLCLEHFRHLGDGGPAWNAKPLHLRSNGGPAENIADFFDGQASREQFKRKLAWYAGRYGDEPAVFGWELWNEVDCVGGGDYLAWSEVMLGELHRLFPRNLAMQSLGSYDTAKKREMYRRHSLMSGNDVAQVHRYLDLGAQLTACKGPMDELAADSVRDLRSFEAGRPILLAESGAVEPSHSGPFKLYAKDKAGMLLHDVLFAPFFAGAAGPGHIWHWDVYVDKNNLWHHFSRFAAVVEGIDPPAERFEPMVLAHDRLRVMALKGRRTSLIWCRDRQNTWMSELRDGQAPQRVEGAVVELGTQIRVPGGGVVRVYDPWSDRWSTVAAEGGRIRLPAFVRSVVIRIESAGN